MRSSNKPAVPGGGDVRLLSAPVGNVKNNDPSLIEPIAGQ